MHKFKIRYLKFFYEEYTNLFQFPSYNIHIVLFLFSANISANYNIDICSYTY